MTRVGVVGAGGRMGREICRAITAAPDLELTAVVDPAFAGTDLADLEGSLPSLTLVQDVEALEGTGVEVVVDFTTAEVARRTMAWCADHGVHAVVGTTGLSRRDLDDAARRFEGSSANAVVAANFAIGAVLLMRLCELAAPHMDSVEVIELHHDRKRDAPSGTAMHTTEGIERARRAAGVGPLPPDPTTETVLVGARGGEGPGGIRVHSVRLPGLVAHEEVVFGAVGQSLSIRHDAYDRSSFMPGVVLAVRQVGSRPGLTVGLETLLGV